MIFFNLFLIWLNINLIKYNDNLFPLDTSCMHSHWKALDFYTKLMFNFSLLSYWLVGWITTSDMARLQFHTHCININGQNIFLPHWIFYSFRNQQKKNIQLDLGCWLFSSLLCVAQVINWYIKVKSVNIYD